MLRRTRIPPWQSEPVKAASTPTTLCASTRVLPERFAGLEEQPRRRTPRPHSTPRTPRRAAVALGAVSRRSIPLASSPKNSEPMEIAERLRTRPDLSGSSARFRIDPCCASGVAWRRTRTLA